MMYSSNSLKKNVQRPLAAMIFACIISTSTSARIQESDDHQHRQINNIRALSVIPNAESTYDIQLSADNKTFTLNLQTNKKLTQLLAINKKNGSTILQGTVSGKPNSWARVTLKEGLYTGAFYDGEELYFIDTTVAVTEFVKLNSTNSLTLAKQSTQVIYKAADVELDASCGLELINSDAKNFDYDSFVAELSTLSASVAGRQINVKIIADTEFNRVTQGLALERMLSEMNIVEGIFSQQVNLVLNITDAIVLTDNGLLNTSDSGLLLENLQAEVAKTIRNEGITHLFTGKDLNGNIIGRAYVDQICTSHGVGLSQKYGNLTSLIAAHEIGHNFGAPHDAQSGSACASTANTFLMNPSITGSNQFSACSLTKIENSITLANARFKNTCVVPINEPDTIAPLFTSQAGSTAKVGTLYQYDNDNVVEVSGSKPLTFTLDYAPDGMTISANGKINWIPTTSQIGINPVQIRVSNIAGDDIQIIDINVTASALTPQLDFNQYTNFSYGGSTQDTSKGSVTIDNNGSTLVLTGNRWRAIELGYKVTADTIIEFDFKSTSKGDIHGIGLDTDLALSADRTFAVYGTQKYGIQDFAYSSIGDYQHFSIPVGEYYEGMMNYLFFAMDHDVSSPNATSAFSNVVIYEKTTTQPTDITLDFNSLSLQGFGSQDTTKGSVTTEEQGLTLKLQGNRWQAATINYEITPKTYLEFDYKSTVKGEIQGIGMDNDLILNPTSLFKVYGTQSYGIENYQYSGSGQYERFSIPIGEFYTGAIQYVFFANDHDVFTPKAVSYFRNVHIIEK